MWIWLLIILSAVFCLGALRRPIAQSLVRSPRRGEPHVVAFLLPVVSMSAQALLVGIPGVLLLAFGGIAETGFPVGCLVTICTPGTSHVDAAPIVQVGWELVCPAVGLLVVAVAVYRRWRGSQLLAIASQGATVAWFALHHGNGGTAEGPASRFLIAEVVIAAMTIAPLVYGVWVQRAATDDVTGVAPEAGAPPAG